MALNNVILERKLAFTRSLDLMNKELNEFTLFFANLPPVVQGDVEWNGEILTHLNTPLRGNSIANRKAALGLLTALAAKAITQGEQDLP